MEINFVCFAAPIVVVLAGCIAVTCADDATGIADGDRSYFRFRSNATLHRLAVDPVSGSLYVGATNFLYRFDPIIAAVDSSSEVLRLTDTASHGPRLDHPLCTEAFGNKACSGGGTTSRFEPALTDNVVKVLAIDPVDRRLITCGSIFQGICDSRNLTNLSQVEYPDYGRGSTDYFVAANSPDESATTVAFVGRGLDPRRPALYVATTYTGTGSTSVRQTVPAVSSRSLGTGSASWSGSERFRFAHVDGLTGGTLVKLRSEAIDKFRIEYVAGFESPVTASGPGFAYFLSVQPDRFFMDNYGTPPTVSAERSSRIIRVCQSDSSFYSYVEMPIRCRQQSGSGVDGSTNVDYNRVKAAVLVRASEVLGGKLGIAPDEAVLVAIFSADSPTVRSGSMRTGASVTPSTSTTSNRSAVCVYRYADVRRKFTENIRRCFSGQQRHVGLQFGNRMCVSLGTAINDSYCGEAEQNGPLVGNLSIEATPIVSYTSTQLTAVATSESNGHLVIWLGTADGHLKKVALQSDGSWREFNDVVIEAGSPVNRDLVINHNSSSLFAMTANTISEVPLFDCERHQTCESCHVAGDPHCGWCSLERRCTSRSSCLDSHLDNRWLSYDAWECIRVPHQFVNPTRVSAGSQTQVSVGIKALPQLQNGDRYLCVFGANGTAVPGTVSPNEVRCITPSNLTFPGNKDHVNITLFIRSTRTGVDFVDTTLTVYNCSKHNSCTRCSQSQWGCVWCIGRNTCTSPTDDSGCSDVVVQEPQTCPRLTHTPGSKITVPFNVPVEISLSTASLPSFATTFECLVYLTAPAIRIPARRLNDSRLICSSYMYTYEADEPEKTVSIEVAWNEDFIVDDGYGTTVTVYRCDLLANDCSTCLSLSESPDTESYGCRWCSDSCTSNKSCVGDQPEMSSCPVAHIDSVYPLTGPTEGGTRLTIQGTNLGRSAKQVLRTVTVAGIPCDVIATEYVISRQIVCVTGASRGSRTGDVIVAISNLSVSWNERFNYQNPEVHGVYPSVGPMSGGTKLNVTGVNLNTGGTVHVLLGNATCSDVRISKDGKSMLCTTAGVVNSGVLPVTVHFDAIVRKLDTDFVYMENPSISKIFPMSSFVSGGRTITVLGSNFNSIQLPVMHLSNQVTKYSTECKVKDASQLHCPSPSLRRHRSQRSVNSMTFSVSFTMDGVQSVRDIVRNFPDVNSTFVAVSDPVYREFDGGKKIYKGEALILTGQNLNAACQMDEVSVWIGNATCRVNSLDSSTLYCSPPAVQPIGQKVESGRNLPMVKVLVGNLLFKLGRLEYQKFEVDSTDGSSMRWLIVAMAAGCGGALLTIIAIIVTVYKFKSTRAKRQFAKLQMQLDVLESNIRHECKQAFAELQTEVIDFTSDLNVIGIPFWDYRMFTFKVLFPSHRDHPILHTDTWKTNGVNGHNNHSASNFYQLLNISHFLLVFVRTLEEQKSFSIKDKSNYMIDTTYESIMSNVASLLMVIFRDKMEYMTEIITVLLNSLIDRSLERRTPKLMLRRTESVVEKLVTNWLSLCMYPYLKSHAIKPLFMLYKAIKHQTEKGPVDAFTGEARYSLSEVRLLREKTEARTLCVYLLSSQNDSREPVSCRMLDCDTITQAKEKALDAIYMNTPFSKRPSVNDLDLVWIATRRGTLILRDEDATSVVCKSWKRVNTLAHYNITEGSTLALQARQLYTATSTIAKNGTVRQHNGKMDICHSTFSRGLSAPVFPAEEDSKLYHLTRHDDGQLNAGRGQKVISEIFLTRLLATKCTLQQYVDDLFTTILRVDSSLPPAVRFLFNFFDNAAVRRNITDADVVHTWKSNSLLLRFWVNIITNPEFAFDIHKSHIVDSCLSVVAQTFIDSCSTHEQQLGKDSPSSKLLYAKEIPRYRQLISAFYSGVQQLPPVGDLEMSLIMADHSTMYTTDLNTEAAVTELLAYCRQYRYELLEALGDDSMSRRLQLGCRFEQLFSATVSDERSPLFC